MTTLNGDFYLGPHFGGFREKMPHVLLLDMAIHSFDQARVISGADPLAVYCHEWNPRGSWYERDASAIALFEMSNGVVYTYRGSWCAEGAETSWECDWKAFGSRGTVAWDGGNQFRARSVEKDEGIIRPMKEIRSPRRRARGRTDTRSAFATSSTACARIVLPRRFAPKTSRAWPWSLARLKALGPGSASRLLYE